LLEEDNGYRGLDRNQANLCVASKNGFMMGWFMDWAGL
jgi:hypothetical protein